MPLRNTMSDGGSRQPPSHSSLSRVVCPPMNAAATQKPAATRSRITSARTSAPRAEKPDLFHQTAGA